MSGRWALPSGSGRQRPLAKYLAGRKIPFTLTSYYRTKDLKGECYGTIEIER